MNSYGSYRLAQIIQVLWLDYGIQRAPKIVQIYVRMNGVTLMTVDSIMTLRYRFHAVMIYNHY